MKPSNSRNWLLPVTIGVAVALSAPAGLGQDNGDDEEEELEFEEAQLFFELNDTDGDLGIQALIDGEAWRNLTLEGPGDDEELLNVWLRGRLRRQGLTEFFFESEEPGFDELTPAQFFRRFPQGEYEFEGTTLEGEEIEGELRLSHVMAGPPAVVRVNGQIGAANCDGDLPVVSGPVTINWTPVTMSHPTIGIPNVPVQVKQYQFVCEIEREGKVPEEIALTVDLPRTRTQFTCPVEFNSLSDGEVKYEIITKLSNNNQTAVESCFELRQQ